MKAVAKDLLGKAPDLELTDYDFIDIDDIHIEIRNGVLTLRSIKGEGLMVKPIVSNTIEVFRVEYNFDTRKRELVNLDYSNRNVRSDSINPQKR